MLSQFYFLKSMSFVVLVIIPSLVQLLWCWLSVCQLQIDQLSFDCMEVQSCALIGVVLFKTECQNQSFLKRKCLQTAVTYNLEHVCEFNAIYVH